MNEYNKITALYSSLSVGDEDRDGGESNNIQNQKIFLENYARGQRLTNIRHYIDDESGRFFDCSAYSRMIEDVESGKIGVCIKTYGSTYHLDDAHVRDMLPDRTARNVFLPFIIDGFRRIKERNTFKYQQAA